MEGAKFSFFFKVSKKKKKMACYHLAQHSVFLGLGSNSVSRLLRCGERGAGSCHTPQLKCCPCGTPSHHSVLERGLLSGLLLSPAPPSPATRGKGRGSESQAWAPASAQIKVSPGCESRVGCGLGKVLTWAVKWEPTSTGY